MLAIDRFTRHSAVGECGRQGSIAVVTYPQRRLGKGAKQADLVILRNEGARAQDMGIPQNYYTAKQRAARRAKLPGPAAPPRPPPATARCLT